MNDDFTDIKQLKSQLKLLTSDKKQ